MADLDDELAITRHIFANLGSYSSFRMGYISELTAEAPDGKTKRREGEGGARCDIIG